MTSRNSNARRRLPPPSKKKPARAVKRLPPANTREKQEQPSSNVLLVSPPTEAHNSQGDSQNKANASPPANPVSAPRPFDRDKEKTMSVKEAAFLLKKHEDTVYLWLRSGRLRGWQPGGLPSEGSMPKDGPSDAQLWKIRQIEQYLGWGRPGKDERRLAGFLRTKFHVDQPEELTADSASSAIEALCAVGARQRIKARKGKAYAVKRAELTREVARLKHELQEWRPAES